ncbi:MAG: LuxR C-terminal-related transcriptional regulator [Gaiellaceae bacterium]
MGSAEERLVVGPLGLAALDHLVQARFEARFLRPTLRQLERASDGNPFYALELAASLLRSGRRLEPGEPLPVPGRLRELVSERLSTLTPGGRRAALAAAALAQPTEAALRRAAGAIDDALGAGVLVREGETVRFAHPLLASTLLEDTSAAERRRLHRQLARLVDDPEERARHLAEAAAGPDEKVAEALELAAAKVAARGLPDSSAQLAKRAVELTPPDNRSGAHRRRLAWARYVLAAGDPRRAEALLEQHLELAAPGSERAEVALELGKTSFASRGTAAGRAWFEQALHQLDRAGGVELRAAVLLELAGMDLEEVRVDSETFEQALVLAERVAEPALLARALGLFAAKLDLLEGAQPSDGYWQRALAVEAETGELRIDGPTAAYGRTLAYLEGQIRRGQALMCKVAASMRRRSDPLLALMLLDLSDTARNVGDWDDADRYIEEASELVAQTGLESRTPACLVYQGRMAMLRGDLERARAKSEEALRLLQERPDSDPWTEGLADSVLGRIAAQSGEPAEAHVRITAHLAQVASTPFRSSRVEPLADLAACLVGLGELEGASRTLSELSELADELSRPEGGWCDALVARTRGLLAEAQGSPASALSEYERAVELLESMPEGWPYELGRTLLLQGSAQRRARQKLAARATLGRALEIFETLGSRLWAEKVGAELRRIGGRPSQLGQLTETERRVAELVAVGRSNADVARELFVSRKTVEWNLSKVYRKLHVRSRTELAAKLARQAVSA